MLKVWGDDMDMKDTKLGQFLILFRIQSTPMTVMALLLGYATVEGTFIRGDAIPLVVAGALAHWGMFAMNDYVDREHDMESKEDRSDKPLINGSISIREAAYVMYVLCALPLVIAAWSFNTASLGFFIVAYALGLAYNFASKATYLSPVLLGLWGTSVVLTGAQYSRGLTVESVFMAVLMGLFMFWLTILGDFKDVDQDEESIPRVLGVKVSSNGLLVKSHSFYQASAVIIGSFTFLIIFLADGAPGWAYVGALFFGSVGSWVTAEITLRRVWYDQKAIKKNITMHAGTLILAMALASSSYLGAYSYFLAIAGTVAWQLAWQLALYGDPLYFP